MSDLTPRQALIIELEKELLRIKEYPDSVVDEEFEELDHEGYIKAFSWGFGRHLDTNQGKFYASCQIKIKEL